MDMEAALRARLIAAAPVNALVDSRVYWEERPQATALPAITLTLVVDDREQHMTGFQELKRALVQIDVWAASFASKKAIKEAVIAALAPANSANGIAFRRATNIRSRPANERLETQLVYREIIEMELYYSTS